jgi:hypothetical protein
MEVEKDRWYPSPPPGWPAILALGVLLGIPWLVNPVLAGFNVLLTFLLIREIYDRRTARMAVLLLCISPWHVFMAMNFMAHTFTLTCALVAAVAVVWARKTGKAWWGWVSGLATGMVSLLRPLEGFVVAGLLGLWAIGVGGRRLKVSAIGVFVLGCMVVGGAVLPYNKLLTGNPMVFPIMAYTDKHFGPKTNALGFGPERGMGWPLDPFPGHGPLDALVNANLNTFSLNIELFGWSTGSLILIALLVFGGAWRKSDYLMLAVIAAVFVVHIFYWYSGGPDFGARYWYLMLIPCVALTVRGIQFLMSALESGPTGAKSGERRAKSREQRAESRGLNSTLYALGSTLEGARVTVAVLSLCLLTLVNYFPWRAIDKYHHYLGMRPDIRTLAKEYGFGKSLVLVRGNGFPDYASAAAYNPVDLRADAPVYAWDRSPEARAQLLEAYPDRPVWIVNSPSMTHRGFEVVGGPLPAHELLAKEKMNKKR